MQEFSDYIRGINCLTVTKPVYSGKKKKVKDDIHHSRGESITRTQDNEEQTGSIALWKHKWGLQGQAIPCVPLRESEGV